MTRPNFIVLAIISLITVVGVVLFGPTPNASALTLSSSDFTYDIIDDPVFINTSSLSASGIQAFLNSEGSGLANFRDIENCGSTSGPHYAYYATYYKCGTRQVAAQIIYDAAHAYGINPMVIIATLQKEQSLITTPNPTASQLNYAMGYGCPDSGGCSYPGFFNQVDNGTWQFRTDMSLGSGDSWWGFSPSDYPCNGATQYYSAPLKAGNTVTFKDDSGTAYNTLTLTDMSTATLYCYTPHVYNNPEGINGLPQYGTTGQYYTGSYNFAYYFTLWFGSPVGELVRTPSSAQIYITNADTNTKYPVNSLTLLNDLGRLGVRYVSSSYLNSFTTGNAATGMYQGPDNTLYLVDASIRLPFSNCSGDVAAYGYTCNSSQYIPLTTGQINKLVNGPHVSVLMKSNVSNTIYYMDAGKKRPFLSFTDLKSLHMPLSVNVFNTNLTNRYAAGTPLYGYGSLLKTANSSTVYAVSGINSLLPVTNFIYPKELGLSTSVRTMSSTDFQQTYGSASGASNLTNKVICSSTNYVGTSGLPLYLVPAGVATDYGYTNTNFLDVSNICYVLKVNRQNLGQYLRDPNGTIYYISSGQKHAFTSYSAFQSPSYCNNTCTYNQVSSFFAGTIPTGSNISN